MVLTREHAEASNLVIGTLPILGRAARVLVDPGASLCFASEEFYESLVRHTPERQCDVMVDLSFGDYMRSFGYLEGVNKGILTTLPEEDPEVMTSLSVRPSMYRQVLQAQQADSELADILQVLDVELNEDSQGMLFILVPPPTNSLPSKGCGKASGTPEKDPNLSEHPARRLTSLTK
ncbi:hypothetical protein Taro_001002 [Colocasia esculenta]|uniref:Uncharacterized protein n=1 Tax=Colocasia esculenta TaxID=4460 RepID=A0A843TDI6_COLES|nr:hypothetical protein [Colocasia esculenta]